MGRVTLLGLLVACGLAASSDDPKPAPDPKKPMYERLLAGDDARRAAELQKRMNSTTDAGEMVKLGEELLALRTRVQGADHWETVGDRQGVDSLRKIAALTAERQAGWAKACRTNAEAHRLEEMGEVAKAYPLRQEYHRWCERVFGEKDVATAFGCYFLAGNLVGQGREAEAEPLFRRALEIRAELLRDTHPDTAESYRDLAGSLTRLGRPADAEPLLRRSLEIRAELLGDRHPETADCHNSLALNLDAQGKYAGALPHYQRALELYREAFGERHPSTARGLDNLAGNLQSQGRPVEAEGLHRRALEVRVELLGERNAETLINYGNLASSLGAQGRHAEAQPLHQKALDLTIELHGQRALQTGPRLNNLALVLSAQGRHADAQRHLEQALDVYRERIGERHPGTARVYNNLAVNLSTQRRHADAESLFRKALDLRAELLGDSHPETAATLLNLADNLFVQGKHAETRGVLARASAAYEAARLNVADRGLTRAVFGGSQSPYRLLAVSQVRLREPSAAWAAAEADLARGLSDEAGVRRGAVLTSDEQREHAALVARLGQLRPRLFKLVANPTTDAERDELTRLRTERAKVEARLADLAAGLSRREVAGLADVQAAIPADAALVLWVDAGDQPGRSQEHWGCVIRRSGGPAWESLPGAGPGGAWAQDDSATPEVLRAALASGTVPAADIGALAARLRAQRIAPLVKHLGGVKTLYVVAAHRMAGVPVELFAGEFTASYVPSGTFLARLKDRAPPAASGLLALGDPVFTRPGTAPAVPELPPTGVLIAQVVPDGGAARALLRPGDVLVTYGGAEVASVEKLTEAMKGHAAAKEVTLGVWREGKLLTRTVPPGPLGVVLDRRPAREAVADRRKTDEILARLRGGGDWKDLPGTRAEVAHLARLFGPGATVLLDGSASEQRLDDLRRGGELSKFRYLHLATHGEGNDRRAFESALILAQDVLPKDPLPRAGEPLIDGRLSAGEVLEFWALRAELVTLSACETAVGLRAGGDGLLGFAQAFLLAGSRAVCLSLWKVDDAATALLMARFYQNLLGKRTGLSAPMGKAAALAEAKRWLRELSADEAGKLLAAATGGASRGDRGKDELLRLAVPADPKQPGASGKPFAHPRYWAAFVLVGDPN
jgi:tetratricopeptide (TPR) repeat protein